MTYVLGIDPGLTGAFAVMCSESRDIVCIDDMPTWTEVTSGGRKRKRVDTLALAELFDKYVMFDVTLAVIEAVGGRPKQSASSAFVFGATVGMIYTCCVYNKLMIEAVPPATWKRLLKVPGKAKADDSAIFQRGQEMFPNQMDFFFTQRRKKLTDRMEAAMMARYGVDYVLHDPGANKDQEGNLLYRL